MEWATWAQIQHEWPLGLKGGGVLSHKVWLGGGGEGRVTGGLKRQDGND